LQTSFLQGYVDALESFKLLDGLAVNNLSKDTVGRMVLSASFAFVAHD
jgi:hypothetical protein